MLRPGRAVPAAAGRWRAESLSPKPPVLELDGLFVHLDDGAGGAVPVVQDVSLSLRPGQCLGLVGESGSGKTVTCLAALGLLDGGLSASGAVRIHGEDFLGAPEAAWRGVRGSRIAMIFQEPTASLNPIVTIGGHLDEVLKRTSDLPRRERRARAAALLHRVGIPDPEQALRLYPHQMSGGMNRRAMITIALAASPSVLIADEPTTALDVTTQAEILSLIRELAEERSMALLLVSHDLGVIAETCDRVAVMYAGRIVETAAPADLLARPRHPYAAGLVAAQPDLTGARHDLRAIPGSVPAPGEIAQGCVFAPRCNHVKDLCRRQAAPALIDVGGGRAAACHHPLSSAAASAATRESAAAPVPRPSGAGEMPHLDIRRLVKGYVRSDGTWFARKRALFPVNDVSLRIAPGEIFGLVGESGCGKTTLARLVLGIETPTAGEIRLGGTDLPTARTKDRKAVARRIQMVFQDAAGALDPRMTVQQIVEEPLRTQGTVADEQIRAKAEAMLAAVGLGPGFARRHPHQLSGGQRQRVVIARALTVDPELLVCDEPVAALDVSVQAQVINLLRAICRERALTVLFISHDLRLVHNLCDRIGVMYLGRLVEVAETETFFAAPAHPYSRSLIAAVPQVRARAGGERFRVNGEPPSPTDPPSGCAFHPRCPLAEARCTGEAPVLRAGADGRVVACHASAEGG